MIIVEAKAMILTLKYRKIADIQEGWTIRNDST